MLLALGLFVFAIPTAAYEELQRRTSWNHGKTPRVGVRGARQFVGPDEDQVRLSGWIPSEIGDRRSIEQLRAMGDEGEAYALVSGVGEVWGAFIIEDLDETQKVIFDDGVPRRTDFQISLARIEDADALDTRSETKPAGGAQAPADAAPDRGGGATQAEIDAAYRANGGATPEELEAIRNESGGGPA